MEFWSRRTFCLISGASRGFGSSLATTFSKKLVADSVLVLLARSSYNLEQVKASIEAQRSDLKVFTWDIDLLNADSEEIKRHFLDLFTKEPGCHFSKFPQCLIVHNVATLGNVSVPFTGLLDKKEQDAYWSLNLTSAILLNSVFFSFFTKSSTVHRNVVQISSIGALKPFKYWSLYCAAKAARDIMFKTMAEEEGDMRVLSYAPGPLQTDMFDQAISQTAHKETQDLLEEMQKQGVLTCEQSANKLINILKNEKFESGSHMDYFDLDDQGLPLAVVTQ